MVLLTHDQKWRIYCSKVVVIYFNYKKKGKGLPSDSALLYSNNNNGISFLVEKIRKTVLMINRGNFTGQLSGF